MALFRRRRASDEHVEGVQASPAEADAWDDDEGLEPAEEPAVPSARDGGPFDESEADLADQALPRLDLGSIRIPGLPGLGIQVEADPNTQEVRAVTAVAEEAAVQVQVFAAPRSEGLWDEIRAEMLEEIRATEGAEVVQADGPFGPELRAVVPARTPEGQQVRQPLRFAGIDGPRWFMRAVFLGRAAVEPEPDDELHELVRQTIVVRGGEAMAPRDPLPLRLPEDAPDLEVDEDALDEDEDPATRYDDLDPFERGPEITEVR